MGCGATVTRVIDGRSVDGRPISPEVYALYLAARLAEERGDLELALCRYAAVLDEDPHAIEAWIRRGALECHIQPKNAARSLAQAQELDPSHPGVFAARAECAKRRGEREKALRFARRAFELEPTDFEFTRHLASALVDAGRSDEAEALLSGWLRRRPRDRRILEFWCNLRPGSQELIKAVLSEHDPALATQKAALPLPFVRTDPPNLARARNRGLVNQLDAALARGDRAEALTISRQLGLPLLELVARARAAGATELELELSLIALRLTPDQVPLWLRAIDLAVRLGQEVAEKELLTRLPTVKRPLTAQERTLLRQLLARRVGNQAARLID